MLHNRRAVSWIGNLLVALSHLLASLAIADDRPVFYIDQGACPFECCTYREWGTREAAELYAEPKTGSPIVGTAEKGTTVKAQTGEVHTKPGKLIVTRDVGEFRKGDVLWVYTYLGEGTFRIWYRGSFIKAYVDSDDWAYFETVPDSVWWVKIRTPGGIEGWTNESENFSNQDACAG